MLREWIFYQIRKRVKENDCLQQGEVNYGGMNINRVQRN